MNKDYTHITIVLDRSGSMGYPASVWTDTIGGLKSTITEQKKNKEKCTFSLYNFDNIIEQNLDFVDIQLVSENVEEFGLAPRGGTALYDAIGRATSETGARLAKMSEAERPGRVLIIVQTDGEENQSREYTSKQIAALIKEQEEKYNWQFQFVGSDQKSVLEATQILGFKASNTAFYDASNTKGTFDILNSKLSMTRSANHALYSSGATMAFSTEEKAAMASDTKETILK